MNGSLKVIAELGIVAFALAAGSCFAAGDVVKAAAGGEESQNQSWNREQRINRKIGVLAIIQQKAQVRAEQRQDRMASMSWYGMSNSRPNAATTPFTSRYSSVWEMPGGRPYSWNPSWSRPDYVLYWH